MMTGSMADAYFPPTCWDQLLWRRHWPSLWKQRLQAACPEPPWWEDWALWSSLAGTQTHTGTHIQKKNTQHKEKLCGFFFLEEQTIIFGFQPQKLYAGPNNTVWMKWAMTHFKKNTVMKVNMTTNNNVSINEWKCLFISLCSLTAKLPWSS